MFGSSFGQPQQQAQQQPQQGGLFGNTANTTQQSGGLFGNTTNNTQQQTGGLFGNTANNSNTANNTQPTGGLFGNSGNNQQSGGLFGGVNNSQQSGGLFGAASNTQQSGGFFGGANSQQQQQLQQQQQQPQQTGLFGSNTSSATTQQPSFSWSKPSDQAPANTGFQTNNNMASGVGALTTQSLFNNTASNPNATQLAVTLLQRQQQTSGPSVIDQIEKIKDSWDPTSPQCALQCFFYNKVGTQQALLYQKPAGIEQARWDAAMAARPDDAHVPVHVVGFTDLQKRVARQEATVLVYRQRMHEINDKLNQLSSRHDLHTLVKTAQMQARHQRLVQRTLALAARLQVLRHRGFVLKPDEEVLKRELERLNQQVDDPAVFGRINEIWARLTVLRERAQALNQRVDEHDRLSSAVAAASSAGSSGLDWNDEQLEKLAKVLKAQQVGIAYLADVLQTDTAKVESIIEEQQQQQRQPLKRRW
jgi:nuclear pore complex protein Nup54